MATERTSAGFVRIVLVILGVVLLFPLLKRVFSMPMMGMMGMWWRGDHVAGGFTPLWGIGTMLVWLVVLVGIKHLVLPPEFETDAPGRNTE